MVESFLGHDKDREKPLGSKTNHNIGCVLWRLTIAYFANPMQVSTTNLVKVSTKVDLNSSCYANYWGTIFSVLVVNLD